MRYLLTALIALVLSACQGYHINGTKPDYLSEIKTVAVPQFDNDTLEVRLGSLATNSAVDSLTRDATFTIGNAEDADAVLVGRVTNVNYGQVSSSRIDSLRSEELSATVIIHWKLIDNTTQRVLDQGSSRGTTRFIADGNLQTARRNGMPDATKRATDSMVLTLANGF
ncbi:LPS assembly lipoprotein LptE [Persicirhabdus sediminis]|uniref:LPS-assembly lipoprotein n=1 Tax=Persicirhabdus sediminis TaxID=454144 RepID=A0A8J7MCE2_9BACT|nr:LPS assembly lipoprotein LptE [Persicirhabdus sediminis]MBK1789877.1 hypothetical protein [Persicirhabdus sediminis]